MATSTRTVGVLDNTESSSKTITKLSTKIKSNEYTMSSYMAAKWHSVKYYLNKNHVSSILGVNAVVAEKYKGDLDGLFIEVFQIPKKYLYPHAIVNGYDSSSCYEGATLNFKMLDQEVLQQYYKLFLQTE